jgi:hypothetical protein
MRVFRMRHVPALWIGTAVVVLLFASSAVLYAQDEKKQEEKKKPENKPPASKPARGARAGRSGDATQTGRGGTAQTRGGTANTDEANRRRGDTGASRAGQFGTTQIGGTGAARTGQAGTTRAGQTGTASGPRRLQTNQPLVVRTQSGGAVYRRTDGTIREVRTTRGAVITHAPGGAAFVRTEQPGGRVMVANHAGFGYVERPFRGGAFVQRTYFTHGSRYVNVYQPYRWGGSVFDVYAPSRYYRSAFYTWLWDPWTTPISYSSWGWSGRPWYGYYGSYFSPYRYYAAPRFWLTDFILAAILEQAYQDRVDANFAGYRPSQYASTSQVALTPEVKQAIADEVQRQIELERSQGQTLSQSFLDAPGDNGRPPSLAGDGPHVFVVSQGLDVTSVSDGQPCAVTGGDVLQMVRPLAPGATDADVVVLASKRQDCARRSVVSVPLGELVEMQNLMRETLDQGLQSLQSHQGQGGLPTLPSAAAAPPVDAPYAAETAADANVADQLRAASQEAIQAEQDVISQAADRPGGTAAPVRISLGQTIAEVEAAMGTPRQIVDLGSKKIYVYEDLKITFIDGRVSDVQ